MNTLDAADVVKAKSCGHTIYNNKYISLPLGLRDISFRSTQ